MDNAVFVQLSKIKPESSNTECQQASIIEMMMNSGGKRAESQVVAAQKPNNELDSDKRAILKKYLGKNSPQKPLYKGQIGSANMIRRNRERNDSDAPSKFKTGLPIHNNKSSLSVQDSPYSQHLGSESSCFLNIHEKVDSPKNLRSSRQKKHLKEKDMIIENEDFLEDMDECGTLAEKKIEEKVVSASRGELQTKGKRKGAETEEIKEEEERLKSVEDSCSKFMMTSFESDLNEVETAIQNNLRSLEQNVYFAHKLKFSRIDNTPKASQNENELGKIIE